MTIEELKNKALAFTLGLAARRMGGDTAEEILNEYVRLKSTYKKGDIVWCFDDGICKCEILAVSPDTDMGGNLFFSYRVSETTGRTMFFGGWIDESKIFPTREALVDHYAKLLGLNTRVVITAEDLKPYINDPKKK